jgi:WD40 repeat protein
VLWQTIPGRFLSRYINHFNGHSDKVKTVAIHPDGQTFVSGSFDNTIKVWNLHTRKLVRTLEGHFHPVTSIAASLDGQTIVSSSSQEIIVWGVR